MTAIIRQAHHNPNKTVLQAGQFYFTPSKANGARFYSSYTMPNATPKKSSAIEGVIFCMLWICLIPSMSILGSLAGY